MPVDTDHPSICEGGIPQTDLYGGTPLLLDYSSLTIMEADEADLPAMMALYYEAVQDLPLDAQRRVLHAHAQLLKAYAQDMHHTRLLRFNAAALDTALIWECG